MANEKRPNDIIRRQTVSTETDYEMKSRSRLQRDRQSSELRMKEAEARQQRRLVLILTTFMLVAVLFCFYVRLSSRFLQGEKAWADSTLKYLIGTLTGIFIGKNFNMNDLSRGG